MIHAAAATSSVGCLSGCLFEIFFRALQDYYGRKDKQSREVFVRAKVQKQFLSGLADGSLEVALKDEGLEVSRKLRAALSKGLDDGTLDESLRGAEVWNKAHRQVLAGIDSGLLTAAIKASEEAQLIVEVNQKLKADLSKGLDNGSLSDSLREIEVRAKVRDQVCTGIDSGSLGAAIKALNEERLVDAVKQNLQADLLRGLNDDSLGVSLRDAIRRDATTKGDNEEAQVRSNAKAQLLSGLDSGSLSGALEPVKVQAVKQKMLAQLAKGSLGEAHVRSNAKAQLLSGLDSGSLSVALEPLKVQAVKQKMLAQLVKGLHDDSLGETLSKVASQKSRESDDRFPSRSFSPLAFLPWTPKEKRAKSTEGKSANEKAGPSPPKEKRARSKPEGKKANEKAGPRGRWFDSIIPKLPGVNQAAKVRGKVEAQLLLGLESGSLATALIDEEWIKVKQKMKADLLTGLNNGSLCGALHPEKVAQVRAKLGSQLLVSQDSGFLEAALKLQTCSGVKLKMQTDLLKGLSDGSLWKSLHNENAAQVRAKVESQLVVSHDSGALANSLNVQSPLQVRHKVETDLMKALKDGSLKHSLSFEALMEDTLMGA